MVKNEQITSARHWLYDCGYEDAYNEDAQTVMRLVHRAYDGGWQQFILDGSY